MVHDVNFTNIDDWDIINKHDSDHTDNESWSNRTPYNPRNMSGGSLADLINKRRRSIREKLVTF